MTTSISLKLPQEKSSHDNIENRNSELDQQRSNSQTPSTSSRTHTLPELRSTAAMGHQPHTSKPRSRPHHPAFARWFRPTRQHPHYLQAMQPIQRQRRLTQTSTLPTGGGHRPPQPVVTGGTALPPPNPASPRHSEISPRGIPRWLGGTEHR